MSTRRAIRNCRERGQVIVLFALLVPVLLALGSVVVSVGNWYVLKRHLQTQVDAAALAGGSMANGCQADPLFAQNKIKLEALKYAGDTVRAADPLDPQLPYNQQLEEVDDVRVVLNSTYYWQEGDATDGSMRADGSMLDWSLGTPCTTKSLDVKATDYKVPNLFRWIPLFPSVKARALVEFRKTKNTNGVRPIGVPEFDPVKVAALFVDEGFAASNPASISGRGFIVKQALPSAIHSRSGTHGAASYRASTSITPRITASSFSRAATRTSTSTSETDRLKTSVVRIPCRHAASRKARTGGFRSFTSMQELVAA